jgi:thiol-disulfide isomerase/thioredoxin
MKTGGMMTKPLNSKMTLLILAMLVIVPEIMPTSRLLGEEIGETTGMIAQPNAISEAELEAFELIEFTEKVQFPLEGLVTLEGKVFDPQGIAGKYIFLNLWATWCPYCAREKASIQELYEKYSNGSFELLTISVGEEGETVRGYLEEHGYGFPVVLDEGNSLRAEYAPRIPQTYLLDREGKILVGITRNREWTEEGTLRVLRHYIPVL